VKYVIIGNSAAGIGAVEGIRQVDGQGEITIVSSEPHHAYSRPLISYLLLGKTTPEKMKYRAAGFYADHSCKLLAGTAAVRVEAGEKRVVLEDGQALLYDKLLVATGSAALVPPFDGLETVNDRFTFMGLDDALRLDKALAGGKKRALIIGAGLIGLKCAEGISGKASPITVLDLAPQILPSILDEDGAKLVQGHLEGQGVEFVLSAVVKRLEKDTAILENGREICFDVLVLAAGVTPNTALLRGIAEIDKGIVINTKSETTAADIYAAGDCTQTLDVSSGRRRIMALLPNAYMQGECAGINMAGGERAFDTAIPMNAIGLLGLHMITAGNYQGEAYSQTENGNYKRLYHSDNRLNGYIMIGNVEKAGIYTSLVRERTPLDSIDFPLICEKPGLMAFTKEDRMLKLGGLM
jgi:NAD(P)H-nitrite reductase large subunit